MSISVCLEGAAARATPETETVQGEASSSSVGETANANANRVEISETETGGGQSSKVDGDRDGEGEKVESPAPKTTEINTADAQEQTTENVVVGGDPTHTQEEIPAAEALEQTTENVEVEGHATHAQAEIPAAEAQEQHTKNVDVELEGHAPQTQAQIPAEAAADRAETEAKINADAGEHSTTKNAVNIGAETQTQIESQAEIKNAEGNPQTDLPVLMEADTMDMGVENEKPGGIGIGGVANAGIQAAGNSTAHDIDPGSTQDDKMDVDSDPDARDDEQAKKLIEKFGVRTVFMCEITPFKQQFLRCSMKFLKEALPPEKSDPTATDELTLFTVVPTILPNAKMWDVKRGRLLLGQEMMALQGLYMSDLRGYVPAGVTQHQIGDLAGNAYTDMLLLNDGCYANLYTNQTKAFKVRIVGFTGVSKYDVYDYTDACHTLYRPKRTLNEGQCTRFAVGGYFAELRSRLRSSTCVGDSCSRMAVTTQRFYSEANCLGLPYQIYTYPVQTECMRWSNGTQTFRVDPTTTNVTQVDYLVNDKCGGDNVRIYVMSVGYCYELYPDRAPRSFKWEAIGFEILESTGCNELVLLLDRSELVPLPFRTSELTETEGRDFSEKGGEIRRDRGGGDLEARGAPNAGCSNGWCALAPRLLTLAKTVSLVDEAYGRHGPLHRPWYEARDAPAEKKEVLVKELVLDSAVVDIVYLGQKHECLLLTTKKQRLYSSCDSGQSWHEITDKVDTTPSSHIRVEKIIVNSADKTVAVLQTQRRVDNRGAGVIDPASASAQSWHPYIFISEDSGRTWRKAWGRHHGLHSWIPHPTRRSWALVSWWNGACSKASGGEIEGASDDEAKKAAKDASKEGDPDKDKPCMHRLMLTTDLGKTFLQIAPYVVQFSWGSPKINQSDRIYYTAYASKTGDQGKLSQWSTEVDFKAVDLESLGRPKVPVTSVKHGNKFMISNEFILVAKVSSEERQTVNLMVSSDGAKTWKAALLPSGMGELEEKWYTIVDTSEGAVLLHLNSETVVSLTGVYLANVLADAEGDAGYQKGKQWAVETVEQDASEGSSVDRRHGRGWGKASRTAKEERSIRTVISFDKGGSWRYLKPPKVNSQGQPYFCAGRPLQECALHLHGSSSWDLYAPFYSSENCVGIIMGTGNVGASLRFEPEETSTFFSRDGGLTWVEAHKGAFIYEFGDHGGLIVMADDLKKTGEVIFTWNEGESWYDFKVTNTPFEVDNIITEPNLTSTTFVMFGTREDGAGVLYYLKFDSLQFPACRGSGFADSVSSDYETWTASDGRGAERCMLGQQITYTRRKRTSQCWNGEAFERPTVKKTCACTEADYACDVGFVRQVGSTECVFGGLEMMPERRGGFGRRQAAPGR
ncbi:unnamed protein product [Durusdinium trenchii]|uniref:VPS10 domain-containing protein n=1 Tax=Durusdinium trenchii TaxID=1381693 RepID=A0ABP0J4B5_9DINO